MTSISKELGPRKQANKVNEMTVRRALAIIQVFDSQEDAKDWSDYEPKDIKAALGEDRFDPQMAVLPELWARYKDKRLHQQVEDLAANIDLEGLSKKSRKEIEDGLARISKR